MKVCVACGVLILVKHGHFMLLSTQHCNFCVMAPGIEDDDAIKLEAAEYKTVAMLKCATREGLEKAGLVPACVGLLMRFIGGAKS